WRRVSCASSAPRTTTRKAWRRSARSASRASRVNEAVNEVADKQQLAEQCAQRMWSNDRASQALGMVIESIAPGCAVLSMHVREDMTNGHDICHGGHIFTL